MIERDKVGAYVLPNALVSVASKRLDIDRSAYPLKLRLDRERDPSSIEVMDRSNGPAYIFARRDVR
ncbi:hypothetical protein ASF09_13640 [Sphingomonas sp. Leaf242]|nr:hypothetical protein ASF09_13640 [Sphingomonas sp. Leaf242]